MGNVGICCLNAKGVTQVEILQECEYQSEALEADDSVVVMKAL